MSEVKIEMIRDWLGGDDDATILWRALVILSDIANGKYETKLFASEVLMYSEEQE